MFRVSSDQIADLQRKHHLDTAEIYCDELRRSRALGSKFWDDDELIEDTKHYIGIALDELELTSDNDMLGFLKLRHSVGPRFYEITRVRLHLQKNAETAPPGSRILYMLAQFSAAYWMKSRQLAGYFDDRPDQ